VPPGQTLREQRFDETEVCEAKAVSITEVTPPVSDKPPLQDSKMAQCLSVPAIGVHGALDHEVFESIYHPGKLLLLVSWRDTAAAQGWRPAAAVEGAGKVRNRLVRIIRDYGMSERGEAPQYYPAVRRPEDRA
jgi:hypothetical protein